VGDAPGVGFLSAGGDPVEAVRRSNQDIEIKMEGDPMRKPASHPTFGPSFRPTLGTATARLLAVACVAAALAIPSLVSAQTREFTGRVDKVTKKKMIVDNRMGDKVTFIYSKGDTQVEGTKTEWKKLKTKDWVTVSWKFIDKPRKAYKVLVFEKVEDEGGEEEDG
jgi:hypothetical protein